MNVNETVAGATNETTDFSHTLTTIIVPTLFAIIIIVGVTGNSLVLAVFALNQSMQNTTNVLIINLAVSDLCFLIFCVPFTAFQHSASTWPFGGVWCKVHMFLQYASALGSVWTLAFMAFERFIAVAHPVKALKIRTIPNFVRACAVIWVLIFASQSYALVIHGVHSYNLGGVESTACINVAGMDPNRSIEFKAFNWTFNCIGFALPLGVVYGLYSCMIHRLWSGYLVRTLSLSSIKTKKRITKMIAFVAVTFSVCWLPANLWIFWAALMFPTPVVTGSSTFSLLIFTQVLSYMNSCLNPILYGLLSTNFRMGFENAISLVLRKEPKHRLTRQDSSKTKGSSLKRASRRFSLKAPLSLRRFTESRRKTTTNEPRKVPPSLGEAKRRLSQQAFDALPLRLAQRDCATKQVQFRKGSLHLGEMDSDEGNGSPQELDRLFDRDRRDSSRWTASTVTNADSGIGSVQSGMEPDLWEAPQETELCIRNNYFFPIRKTDGPNLTCGKFLGNIEEDREETEFSMGSSEATITLHNEIPKLNKIEADVVINELMCFSANV